MSHISIRLSDDERSLLEEQASKDGLSISRYVRKVIFSNKTSQINVSSVFNVLSEMSTNVNKFKTGGDSNCIIQIEKGMVELWQILS